MAGVNLFAESGVNLRNVYFDTSSSNRIQGSDIKRAIDTFGYEHVVFGTDTPYAGIDAQIEKIEKLNLPDRIKEHVYSLNAKRILSIHDDENNNTFWLTKSVSRYRMQRRLDTALKMNYNTRKMVR